jgi:mycothiol synthase
MKKLEGEMEIPKVEKRILELEDTPSIKGLTFRGFVGEDDFPKMLAVIDGSKRTDQIERGDTLQDVVNTYTHLINCDPYKDMIFAEIDGKVIGYNRGYWRLEAGDKRIFQHFGFLLPAWRRRGIGRTMMAGIEQRLYEVARGQPNEGACFYESMAGEKEIGTQVLLKSRGYQAVRHEFTMVRANLEDIPASPLPTGIEIRPVLDEHLDIIRAASMEAFRDHWGYSEALAPTVDQWKNDPNYDPSLWKVAWEGDQVVGMVLSYINRLENEEYRRKRGWTENICVRRPWRKRGVAQALIAESLRELKMRGFQEAALEVDTENLSGALHLYQRMGYRPVSRNSIYRRLMEITRD